MIQDLVASVEKLTSGRVVSRNASILCLNTTARKYLLFNSEPTAPACVVTIGPKQTMEHTFAVLTSLHESIPQNIPMPLALGKGKLDQYLLVQSGLPGRPWFQLSSRVKSSNDWMNLARRAIDALRKLQSAVEAIPGWSKTLSPGDELRAIWRNCSELDDIRDLQISVEKHCKSLDSLGQIVCQRQHGDFCLNNLLFANDAVGIIDYDEFGLTSMPYHDEFMLYNSIKAISENLPENLMDLLFDELLDGSSVKNIKKREYVFGFYLYHLFYRLFQSKNIRNRHYLVPIITNEIKSFLSEPHKCLPLGR